ncbi:MAG: hypothetical protein M1817_004939 [Caeruleum heppii]|nr:MAG: hypothetical protein M1817_004939 [Caeruleum heppii]
MEPRPAFLDFRSRSQDPPRQGQASPRGLSSPRIAHHDGEIPPALSPLDAFAAQGRLLARQLDDTLEHGRRISRLPPLTIASSLAQGRPGFLRSVSSDDAPQSTVSRALSREDLGTGARAAVLTPDDRPKSVHPRLSGLPTLEPEPLPQLLHTRISERGRSRTPLDLDDTLRPLPDGRGEPSSIRRPGEEAHPRDAAESPIERDARRSGEIPLEHGFVRDDWTHALSASPKRHRQAATGPPRSPLGQSASSIRSSPVGEVNTAMAGSQRRPSTRSNGSPSATTMIPDAIPPNSPLAPPPPLPPPRSPSVSSELSVGGTRQFRAALNFSRPLSRTSRPSLDTPSRQASSDSQRYVFVDDSLHTPVSISSEDNADYTDPFQAPAPSYVYSRYSLPRGRVMRRHPSALVDDPRQTQHHFLWEQPPILQSNVKPVTSDAGKRPVSPPSPPRDDIPRHALSSDRDLGPRRLPYPNRDDGLERREQGQSAPQEGHDQASESPMQSGDSHSVSTKTPTPTVQTPPHRSDIESADVTAEDHLAKGIQCHERGSLNESTYHLRIAAKANHPTAMLLYALACRHGWGMRPNPREGVQWLRKAVDSAGLEVADDEGSLKEGRQPDFVERRTRQAQFALGIYELGVSHMNGWGIEQDKALALRCFEIAGTWGDGDALAEAGFCYAQGVGCKKDLKKAAKFYRMAEGKGMSMVGNSWIYKSKYDEKGDAGGIAAHRTTPEKKVRDKSRTRTIFARKKSFVDR